MKKALTTFEETLNSSQLRLNDTYEMIERAKAMVRDDKDGWPNWMVIDQELPVRRPDAEELAIEVRGYAERVEDHKSKQLFLETAEEYERLAGNQTNT